MDKTRSKSLKKKKPEQKTISRKNVKSKEVKGRNISKDKNIRRGRTAKDNNKRNPKNK